MSYIDNDNIGTFNSLEELWAAHPGGGHEGDWCTVDGVIYHWNIYTRAWESTEGNVSTNARKNEWFEGDVTINHNLTVGGSLRAKRIKQPCMGLFSTEESLTSHWPDPVVGMWAIVGTAPPFIIWRCDEDGVWTNTGEETEGFDGLELVEVEEAISDLQDELDGKIDKVDIADNLTTDSPTKVLSARQGKILNEKKLDYYDTSWIYSASQRTEENFNALKAASLAQKFVVANGNVCISDAETFENKVVLSNFREGGYNHIEVSLREGAVGVSFRFIVYAESADVVSLGERVTTAEGDITTLGGRVTSVETWQTQAGNPGSLPHYHSANWLEDEEGSYSAEHPERRLKVRYTSMINAINDNRLIKLHNVTASGVDVNDSVISAVFMTTNANGTSQTVRYYVRYTSGDDYCTVEKKEIPMPYYDATWATMIGGSLEQLEEFINVINSTPKALVIAGNQPVVWAARRTPYMVQFAVMRDSGLRIYTTEYDSDAGETYPTYEDKSFQELLVSGTNIKTINNQSLLGSGNITIQGGGGSSVQSDWNQSDSSADDYIKNKPSLASVATSGSYNDLSNKPTIPAAQIQADWNQSTTTAKDYIKNKPTIPTVPTNVSAFNNDAGYLNGNFCPIIEDTRISAVAAITGDAPFSSLVNGQRIVLHFNQKGKDSPTLNLRKSGGDYTGPIPIRESSQNVGEGIVFSSVFAGSYLELVYNEYLNKWLTIGQLDSNTTYDSNTQAKITAGTDTAGRLISPKLIHDNAYIVEQSYTSGSLKANKFYDFGTVSTALTIPTLDATNDLVSNALNFYALRFVAGADNISITFPTGVLVDDTPTINTGDYVEIMINLYVVNGVNNFYASIKVWQAQ